MIKGKKGEIATIVSFCYGDCVWLINGEARRISQLCCDGEVALVDEFLT